MTADSVKSLLAARTQPQSISQVTDVVPVGESFENFHCGRIGNRPQMMITFEKADGQALTVAYSHLYTVRSNNINAGFWLRFSEDNVEIHGRNLERVADMIRAHRLQILREPIGGVEFDVSPKAATPVVTRIEFKPLGTLNIAK